MAMTKGAFGIRSWIAQLIMERFHDCGNGVRCRQPILLLKRIGYVSNGVCEENTPSRGFIATVFLPEPHLDRAMLALLSNPSTEHLDRSVITLRCRWDY